MKQPKFDKIKLGIGRNGKADSYQTSYPDRDGKMIFRMLTPDPLQIETKIKNNPIYEFQNEWTDNDNFQEIIEDIIVLHNRIVEKTNEDFNYSIVDGWKIVDKMKPAKNQRPLTDHVKKLVKKIQEKGYLLHPILVTKDFKITDGNHRFNALKILKDKGVNISMPVLINGNSTEEDFVSANVDKKNLSPLDFVRSHALQGIEDYEHLYNALNKHSDLNKTVVIRAYSKDNSSKYKEGEFVLGEHGDKIIEIIRKVDAKLNSFNATKSAWSNSINKIYRENQSMDIDRFIDKIPLNMEDLASEKEITYKLCLEYNRGLDKFGNIDRIV